MPVSAAGAKLLWPYEVERYFLKIQQRNPNIWFSDIDSISFFLKYEQSNLQKNFWIILMKSILIFFHLNQTRKCNFSHLGNYLYDGKICTNINVTSTNRYHCLHIGYPHPPLLKRSHSYSQALQVSRTCFF